jgi:hypothetical protein
MSVASGSGQCTRHHESRSGSQCHYRRPNASPFLLHQGGRLVDHQDLRV